MMKILKSIKQIMKKTKSTNEQTKSSYNRFGNTVYDHLLDTIGISSEFSNDGYRNSIVLDCYYIAGENCNVIIKLFKGLSQTKEYKNIQNYTVSVINTRGNYIEEVNSDIGILQFIASLNTIELKYGLQKLRKFDEPSDAWKYAHNFSANTDTKQEHTSSQSQSQSNTQSQSKAQHDYSSSDYIPPNASTQTMNYVSLFNGCTDKESLTQRYRQLMKTFHPDNPNGDQKMTQCIQKTYEALRKNY